jgi:hypothetical protein
VKYNVPLSHEAAKHQQAMMWEPFPLFTCTVDPRPAADNLLSSLVKTPGTPMDAFFSMMPLLGPPGFLLQNRILLSSNFLILSLFCVKISYHKEVNIIK